MLQRSQFTHTYTNDIHYKCRHFSTHASDGNSSYCRTMSINSNLSPLKWILGTISNLERLVDEKMVNIQTQTWFDGHEW